MSIYIFISVDLTVLISSFAGIFDGRPADYLFMLLFNWICLTVSLPVNYFKGDWIFNC